MNNTDQFKIKAFLLSDHTPSDLFDLLWERLTDTDKEQFLEQANQSDLDFDHLAHTYGPCDGQEQLMWRSNV